MRNRFPWIRPPGLGEICGMDRSLWPGVWSWPGCREDGYLHGQGACRCRCCENRGCAKMRRERLAKNAVWKSQRDTRNRFLCISVRHELWLCQRQCHARRQGILFRKWHLDIQMQNKFHYSLCTVLGICKCMSKHTNVGQMLVYGGHSDMHTCTDGRWREALCLSVLQHLHTMSASTLTCFHIQITFMIMYITSP